jgi:hypothetical protein
LNWVEEEHNHIAIRGENQSLKSSEKVTSKEENIAHISAIGASRGFVEMLVSIDCMHRKWNNFPNTMHIQFTRHLYDPTIVLEAIFFLGLMDLSLLLWVILFSQ